jgi:heme exporter protein B
MSLWRIAGAIVWKDVVAEWRTREVLSAMFAFAVLVILIFNLAFDLRVGNVREVVPGALWVAITFAGMLGLNRSFVLERDRGSLDGLLLGPMDRSVIYLAKWLSNWLFMSVVEAVTLPLASALFNLNLIRADLLLITALGTGGYAGVGTLFSAMTANTRTREVLLPVLLFPVAVPLLLAAIKATGGLLDGGTLAGVSHWLQILIGFDLIFVILAYVLFDYVVEE